MAAFPKLWREEERHIVRAALARALRERTNPDSDIRVAAKRHVARELASPLHAQMVAARKDLLWEQHISRLVNGDVDRRTATYEPTSNGNTPDVLQEDTRQRVWVKVANRKGVLIPEPMVDIGDDQHDEVANRRAEQVMDLLRKVDWHRAAAGEGRRLALSNGVIAQIMIVSEDPHNE